MTSADPLAIVSGGIAPDNALVIAPEGMSPDDALSSGITPGDASEIASGRISMPLTSVLKIALEGLALADG